MCVCVSERACVCVRERACVCVQACVRACVCNFKERCQVTDTLSSLTFNSFVTSNCSQQCNKTTRHPSVRMLALLQRLLFLTSVWNACTTTCSESR